ncbi:MAG: TRAP transporter TatT component family protein [Acidobacteriota bacterium]
MFVVYLALSTILAGPAVPAAAAQPPGPAAAQPALTDADALYRDREHAASAVAAERILSARVQSAPGDFDAAWQLARVRYWLGTNGPASSDDKKRILERGIDAGRIAIAARPGAAAGHFWMAANMGALSEAHGLRQGIKYRNLIKAALEAALKADPSYLDGSPDRALGRWYFKVPGLFGGDVKQSEVHLRKALAYKTDSVITLLFLGETLLELDRRAEGKAMLQAALDAPFDPDWTPEDTRFKARARQVLATVQ